MEIEISLEGIRINGLTPEDFDRQQREQARQDLVKSLLSDVAARENGLSAEEKLHVLLGCKRRDLLDRDWLASIYAGCGCRAEAGELYAGMGQHRKLGDLALADGDFDAALESFRKPAYDETGKPFRSGVDHDRLMAIAFMRRDWPGFIDAFRAAEFDPLDGRQVIFSCMAHHTAPWARRLALAVVRGSLEADAKLAVEAQRGLMLTPEAWRQLLAWAKSRSDDELAREDQKLVPDGLRIPRSTPAEACARGTTDRAKALLAWIDDAYDGIERARADMQAWLKEGDRSALERAVAWATTGGDYAFTQTALFELTGRYKAFDGPPERVCEVYRTHPQLMRYGLGHYLSLKIQADLPFTGDDLLGSVFQALAWPGREYARASDDEITFARLKSCRDWAEIKLLEWSQNDEGRPVLDKARAALKKLKDFRARDIRREKTWVRAMDKAIVWLGARWAVEIGVAVWRSEMQAFQLLKKAFTGAKVLQHDEPHWLTPQHLDIHIPAHRLAVEYMGRQHYEPIGFFGGEAALARAVERDQRKAKLCQAAGVALEYIRHDEDIGLRANEIAEKYGGAPVRSRPRAAVKRKRKPA